MNPRTPKLTKMPPAMAAKLIAVPMVHINGTSKEELLDQLQQSCAAIDTAMEMVQIAPPNARDYYPYKDPDVWRDACTQHADRLKALARIKDELQVIALAIQDGIHSQGWVEMEVPERT